MTSSSSRALDITVGFLVLSLVESTTTVFKDLNWLAGLEFVI